MVPEQIVLPALYLTSQLCPLALIEAILLVQFALALIFAIHLIVIMAIEGGVFRFTIDLVRFQTGVFKMAPLLLPSLPVSHPTYVI